jgi:hypothetical protein
VLGVETRSGLRGRVVARFAAARTHSADSTLADEGDSPWTLAVLAAALCVIATVSLFVEGNVADVLLGLALAAVVVGVPASLLVGRLRANPSKRHRPPAR